MSWSREHEQESERSQELAAPEQAQTASSPAQRLAASVGNQAFGQIARMGAGLMPDGRVHPDVESTIAQSRGGGQTLSQSAQERFGSALDHDLSSVRVHTDDTADTLARSVSARAFATGNDVFFAKGEYAPGSSSGDHLLAHELTHVVQQDGAPTSGPMTVTNEGDANEREADAVAREIA